MKAAAKESSDVPGVIEKVNKKGQGENFTPVGYGSILTGAGIPFTTKGPYLMVGEDFPDSGWMLYISVVKQQGLLLLRSVLPLISEPGFSYAIPENSQVHTMILEGGLGFEQIGKIIAIHVTDREQRSAISGQLVEITQKFRGPEIPGAKLIGGCVYAEYVFSTTLNNPSQQQENSKWPFSNLSPEPVVKKRKWLNGKYYLANLLKSDSKGNVYRGLSINSWFDFQWCLIKQGKANQCFDDAERTIRDRLKWQFDIQLLLAGKVALPKAIDFFQADSDSYFIMEFIEGSSLYDMFNVLQEGTAWFGLRKENKIAIIHYLLQTLDIVRDFHQNGFVHRDLSPVNFMVKQNGQVVAIDIELCYNYLTLQPDPAFTLGTPGYMSVGQSRSAMPCIEDDFYGLGGLMIRAFTGLSPTKFNPDNQEKLYQDINYHVRNQRIAALICSCLDNDPRQRPLLISIKHSLEVFYAMILTENDGPAQKNEDDGDKNKMKEMIARAVPGFFKYPLLGKDETWYSKTEVGEHFIANEFKSYSWYPGFYSGTSGVVYCLGLAEQQGYDFGNNREIFYPNLHKATAYFTGDPIIDSGLLNGSAGFCISFAQLIKLGIVEKNISNFNVISRLLDQSSGQLNLAGGIAGQGLVMIKCADLLAFPAFTGVTADIVSRLVHKQNSDGSWSIKKDTTVRKGVKHTGLFYGIAGIAFFLLEYGVKYYSKYSKAAAIKSLNWLLKRRCLVNRHHLWPVNSKNPAVDPWLEFGFTGIAWVFIKAFEYLNDPRYAEAAKSALYSHPKFIASNYLSQASGLAGLGEVYLEAYRVFKEKEWLDRASHIASFLTHCTHELADGSLYWLDGSDNLPTADFMTGNSGIIHFLIRFNNPERISFPLLSI